MVILTILIVLVLNTLRAVGRGEGRRVSNFLVKVRDWSTLARTDAFFANSNSPSVFFLEHTFRGERQLEQGSRGRLSTASPFLSPLSLSLCLLQLPWLSASRIVEQRKGQVSRPRSTLVHRLHHSSPTPLPTLLSSSSQLAHARSNAITTKARTCFETIEESDGDNKKQNNSGYSNEPNKVSNACWHTYVYTYTQYIYIYICMKVLGQFYF